MGLPGRVRRDPQRAVAGRSGERVERPARVRRPACEGRRRGRLRRTLHGSAPRSRSRALGRPQHGAARSGRGPAPPTGADPGDGRIARPGLPQGPMTLTRGRQVLEIEANAILALIDRLDQRFERALALLDQCQGRVVVTGMGKSGIIGRKIAATLASIGVPSVFLHPAEGIHGDLGMVSRGDLVIALSNSGETEELLKILPAIKRLGVPMISLTGNVDSMLAKNSDVVLHFSLKEET